MPACGIAARSHNCRRLAAASRPCRPAASRPCRPAASRPSPAWRSRPAGAACAAIMPPGAGTMPPGWHAVGVGAAGGGGAAIVTELGWSRAGHVLELVVTAAEPQEDAHDDKGDHPVEDDVAVRAEDAAEDVGADAEELPRSAPPSSGCRRRPRRGRGRPRPAWRSSHRATQWSSQSPASSARARVQRGAPSSASSTSK